MLFANVSIFPERASDLAWRVDLLFYVMSAVTGAATILVGVLLVYLCTVYRRHGEKVETPRILGSHKLEIFWTVVPLVIFLGFFAWGVVVFDEGFDIPPEATEIYVVGKQWMWKMQHDDGVREINELHLELGQPVKITLISEDVIHSFGVPAFRDKIDVLPGRYVSTWYKPTKTGRFAIYCDQLCGVGHSQMIGWVHVMDSADYKEWKTGKQPPSNGPTDGSLAGKGRQLFTKLQCIACHNAKGGRAPLLEGIWHTRVPLKGGGTAYVDEGYIAESILKPKSKVHEGWEPIMPTFEGQLKDDSIGLSQHEAINALIAYIRSLGAGQTPRRTEDFWPPQGAPTTTVPEKKKQ